MLRLPTHRGGGYKKIMLIIASYTNDDDRNVHNWWWSALWWWSHHTQWGWWSYHTLMLMLIMIASYILQLYTMPDEPTDGQGDSGVGLPRPQPKKTKCTNFHNLELFVLLKSNKVCELKCTWVMPIFTLWPDGWCRDKARPETKFENKCTFWCKVTFTFWCRYIHILV